MPRRPLSVVACELVRRDARAGETKVVAIDGPSGSGKTTLAGRLKPVLGAESVHMEDIYPGWDGLTAATELLVEDVLRPLAERRAAAYHRWDWERGRPGAVQRVNPGPVLLVEGVGAGARVAAAYLSLLIWVDAPDEVRKGRALARDGETFRPHWDRWARQEHSLFAADETRQRADLRIDGAPEVEWDPATEAVVCE